MSEREYTTIRGAAERYGLNPYTIRRRIADGTLTAYRVGPKLIKLDVAEVEALAQPVPTVRRPA